MDLPNKIRVLVSRPYLDSQKFISQMSLNNQCGIDRMNQCKRPWKQPMNNECLRFDYIKSIYEKTWTLE